MLRVTRQNYDTWLRYPSDRCLAGQGERTVGSLARRAAFALSSPFRYDVLHYYFGRSFMCWDDLGGPSPLWYADLRLARALGRKVFMTLQGCDVRLSDRSADRNRGVGAITATVALQEILYMLLVSVGALPRLTQHPGVAMLMLATTITFSSVFVVLLWRPAYDRAIRLVEHVRFLKRFDTQLHEIRPAFVQLCHWRTLLPIIALQAIAALFSFLLFYLALLAIGLSHVSYIAAVFALGVSYTFGAVSFLPLGIGAFEGLLTVILLTLGIPGMTAAAGAASGLLYRGYNDVLMAFIGAPSLLYVRARQRSGRWRVDRASMATTAVAASD